MIAARVTALVGSAATVLALSGCGVFGGSDSISAHTTGCRTYQIEVGGQDAQAVRLVQRAVQTRGLVNPDIKAALAVVRKAATDAGLVADLPAKDFERYRVLVDATVAVDARSSPPTGTGLTGSTAHVLETAVKAVRDGCTAVKPRTPRNH